jgi:tungstate transport system ATP-binding protein
MNRVLIELRRVAKEYSGRTVLDIEQLDIRQGEILAVLGPSGSGKSTLLRLLNLLEAPTRGSMTVFGQRLPASGPPPLRLRRRMTTVFQRPLLLHRSVYANLIFPLQLRHQTPQPAEVEAVLDRVGLSERRRDQAASLSGGEAQRVALARALLLQPDVLYLDEPTANLDPFNISLIESVLQQLHRQSGTTIVIVTHNVFQAQRLADRAALLLEGRLAALAPAAQFFHQHPDARVRAFVSGDMVY